MSLLAWAVPGFGSNQSSLNPAGPSAAHIEHTFAVIFWITTIVYLLVLTALLYFVALPPHEQWNAIERHTGRAQFEYGDECLHRDRES
jgi:heme/copper-type cytochrome/quinol oxidase subunit 2